MRSAFGSMPQELGHHLSITLIGQMLDAFGSDIGLATAKQPFDGVRRYIQQFTIKDLRLTELTFGMVHEAMNVLGQ